MKSASTEAQLLDANTYLRQEISRCFSSSLGGMLGSDAPASQKASGFPEEAEIVWYRLSFEPTETGALLLGLDRPGALSVGHELLNAAGLEGEPDETALETLGEVLGQLGGGVASSLSARVKKQISAKPIVPVETPPQGEPQVFESLTTPGGNRLTFGVAFSPELIERVTLEPPAPPLAVVPQAAQAVTATLNTKNLDVLLDVELPVSVSFGRAQLQLKDVIKLTTGSIVELNRSVAEPVDIVVNNCVIARGEVVVVEGNFGVRIKQIISKQDRLKTLT